MRKFLSIKENQLDIKYFTILLFIAFIFSIAIRYIWVYQFGGVDSMYWNGELMLNTNDGYYWAEGARDILAGGHQANDLSPVDRNISQLTAFLAKILPVSFETLILWMPAFFGSLLVVPIMLIGRLFKYDEVGFVAALLGSIAWSYYNRTMVGYYDTDLLIVVLPTFMMWGLLWALRTEHNRVMWIAPIFAILSMYWHGGTINIVNATFFLTLLYTAIFERNNIYFYKFLSVFILAMTTLPVSVKFILVIAMVASYHFLKDKLTEKIVIGIVTVSTLIYLVFGGMSWILGILGSGYFTRALHAADLNLSLYYYGVVNTVREAGHIPFETFANRISGDMVTFWLSVIGYILFIMRYRLFMLTLPMVGLGFFALQGGLRFTVFAVPFMALGVSYLIFLIASKIDDKQKQIKYGFITLATVAILYPNITHIIGYKVPTVMNKDEVKVLDRLGKIASREDYVVSWWDYGYPIRYYSDIKTLVDGGKHSGNVNFPVSFSLYKPQIESINMARLDVEYTELAYKNKRGSDYIKLMMEDYNYVDANKFLNDLKDKNFKLPEKTRDVYFYLPFRMLNIFPTVVKFSNMDIMSGKIFSDPLFYFTQNFKDTPQTLFLGQGISLHKQGAIVQLGSQKYNLKRFIEVQVNKNGELVKNEQILDRNSPLTLISMRSYNAFLLVEENMYNSTFIQLFVLENYDKDLFEPVIMSPYAKVFKLKK